jgi:hypothetical protein
VARRIGVLGSWKSRFPSTDASYSSLDTVTERSAPDVDRERHDLDTELLAQPGDGDGRVESAGVGEDDLLHRGASIVT